jgi:hypothetical protein
MEYMKCACADGVSPKIIQGHNIVDKPPTEWTSGANRTMVIRIGLIVDTEAQDPLDEKEDATIMTVIEKAIVRLATIEAGAVLGAVAAVAAARRITEHHRVELLFWKDSQ